MGGAFYFTREIITSNVPVERGRTRDGIMGQEDERYRSGGIVAIRSRLSRVGAAQSKKRRAAAVLFLVATNQTVHSMVSLLLCAAVQAGGLVSSLRYA